MIFGPFAGSVASPIRPGGKIGGATVRASAIDAQEAPPRAMPAPTITTVWAPTPVARAHQHRVRAFLDELVNGKATTLEFVVLGVIWLLGMAYWLADERVREQLWRQVGM